MPDIICSIGRGNEPLLSLVELWLDSPNIEIEQPSSQQIDLSRRLILALPTSVAVSILIPHIENLAVRSAIKVTNFAPGETQLGGTSWEALLTERQILVGTYQQLLSAACNRGTGISPHRWPIQFALLNNDATWIFDRIELAGASLSVALQLECFRQKYHVYGNTQSMFTTSHRKYLTLLRTPDFTPQIETIEPTRSKSYLEVQVRELKKTKIGDIVRFLTDRPWTKKLSLVKCQRIDRAQELYHALKTAKVPTILLHSRFRPQDLQAQIERLNNFKGVVICNQYLDAVDLHADLILTDLAPWSQIGSIADSIGKTGEIYWMDIKSSDPLPHSVPELNWARTQLEQISNLTELAAVEPEVFQPSAHLLTEGDFLKLFCTSDTIEGVYQDLSHYFSPGNRSVYVAWREEIECDRAISTEELCHVSLTDPAHKFLLRYGRSWNPITQAFEKAQVYAGEVIVLPVSAGGYCGELGFTGDSRDKVSETKPAEFIPIDREDADYLATASRRAVDQKTHAIDILAVVTNSLKSLTSFNLPTKIVELACQLHDAGKAHPIQQAAFQQLDPTLDPTKIWAKTSNQDRRINYLLDGKKIIFRHEFVSALIAHSIANTAFNLSQIEVNLLTYLIAAHHGKIRCELLHSYGCKSEDIIPQQRLGINLEIPEIKLATISQLDWIEMVHRLIDSYGVFRLAYLETIVRLSDWKASAIH
jgi:CRISPR-associated endonuclease/helicase Cas3